jgi:hypothetical protein
VLQIKASTLLRALALSSCSSTAAWHFYSTVFIKGIGYPLSVSRLTAAQLHKLQAPMTALTLNRMGYARDLSRTVVYGPRRFGGLDFPSLESAQGAGKLVSHRSGLITKHRRRKLPHNGISFTPITTPGGRVDANRQGLFGRHIWLTTNIQYYHTTIATAR